MQAYLDFLERVFSNGISVDPRINRKIYGAMVLRGRARLSSVVLVATWTLYLRNLTTFVKLWSVNFCRNCIVCKVFNVFFFTVVNLFWFRNLNIIVIS